MADRNLTDDDVKAICDGIHQHGCVAFDASVQEKIIAFGNHTTVAGAEAVGELGTAIAGEKRFYSKVILRAIVLIVASVILILFGKNALPLILK